MPTCSGNAWTAQSATDRRSFAALRAAAASNRSLTSASDETIPLRLGPHHYAPKW
jgi:hypothetical protein